MKWPARQLLGNRMRDALAAAWRALRRATGDDAYERYVAHLHLCHPGEPVMTRHVFYDETQKRKWGGVTRCC